MPPTATCDGDVYLHNLASFIKSHERQLANALLAYKKQPKNDQQRQHQQHLQQLNSKPVRLSLTLHHLYYLLGRFQDLGISVGPMNIRLDNIHSDDTSMNYVSFLSDYHNNKRMSSDAQSIHSMSSVKSVMSSVSALWTSMGSNGNGFKSRDVLVSDLKYLYSAFTKLPCLRLAPDSRLKLIEGHEEYPFDTLVPLKSFKNLSVLEICDLNLKEIYGWNIISEQIKFLVLKKTGINDPVEVLVELVDDDVNLRGSMVEETTIIDNNNNSSNSSTPSEFHHPQYYHKKPTFSKHNHHLSISSAYGTPNFHHQLSGSLPDSHFHQRTSPTLNHATLSRQYTNEDTHHTRPRKNTSSSTNLIVLSPLSSTNHYRRSNGLYVQSTSPPTSSHTLSSSRKLRRSKSNSSDYSVHSRLSPTPTPPPTTTSTPNRWTQLKHLSFTENNISVISEWSFEPLQLLSSLDLSHNNLKEIPAALAHLKSLKSLNLSYNKLESSKGFQRDKLPKLAILNLKNNNLKELTSLEFLKNLEKLDLRSNKLDIKDLKPLLMGTKPLRLQLLFLQNNSMKNYRIELFNLFNGIDYDNNLKIDGSRPGLFESRLLLDSNAAELNLNKFFISQITDSINSMSLSPLQEMTTTTSTETFTNGTGPLDSIPPSSDKAYVLLPPLKPFVRPNLEQRSSQDTLTNTTIVSNHSANSVLVSSGSNKTNTSTATTTIVHSPSLILKSPSIDNKSIHEFQQAKSSINNKSTPNSPHSTMFPTGNYIEPPRTVSASHSSFPSKLNRLSNDLTAIVSTTNNSHELLSHKLVPPLPPVVTLATTTVNSSGNSNSSSQRTSIISTRITSTENKENDGENNSEIIENNEEIQSKMNPGLNPTIVYLMNNQ